MKRREAGSRKAREPRVNKDRCLGLRLTGDLMKAIEAYCKAEDRSLSSAVRILAAKQLQALGYLKD